MFKHRYLTETIEKDLQKKMVFLAGPRQVGKTTLAVRIGKERHKEYQYLNWDNPDHRRAIRELVFSPSADMLIFDELHKFRQWKNLIKGVFDTYRSRFHILVTGSARLDLYRKGGDSLQGRYHPYRLHPFTLAEYRGIGTKTEPFQELHFPKPGTNNLMAYQRLLSRGGFPEPLFALEEREVRRWRNERLDRLVKEDIRDVEMVRDLSALQVLGDLLPKKVGSLLSLNALREDLGIAHKTVALWMDILERFYFHYRLYPFASTLIKSLRKEPKLYLWDWSQVEDEAARLENMVAGHLLKFVHYLHDALGYRAELNFVRDLEGREADFLVSVDGKPWFIAEVKQAETQVSKSLLYARDRLRVPFAYQVIGQSNVDILRQNVRVLSAETFLLALL